MPGPHHAEQPGLARHGERIYPAAQTLAAGARGGRRFNAPGHFFGCPCGGRGCPFAHPGARQPAGVYLRQRRASGPLCRSGGCLWQPRQLVGALAGARWGRAGEFEKSRAVSHRARRAQPGPGPGDWGHQHGRAPGCAGRPAGAGPQAGPGIARKPVLFDGSAPAGLHEWALHRPISGNVDPSTLSSLERDLLKDTLAVVKRFKAVLHQRLRLDLV